MNELRNITNGPVLLPGDEGFDEARRPWSLAVDQPVRAVVEAADAGDVAAVVGYARRHGLAVTAQPSGHGASGDTEGTILLRTGRLGGVEITDGVARVGAGVKWGEVLAAASPLGLTGLAGSAPVVSVTGYTLGGGLSWFSRKHGFAADSVRAFDAVDADGEHVRVTADSDADLFWALRGGGGDFAIVTAVEFGLHPAPFLYGGRVIWPADRAARVMRAFREVTAAAPDELTVWLQLFAPPGGPGFVMIDCTFLGAEPGALLRPFEEIGGAISDTRGLLPVAELGTICDEPADPTPGAGHTELLTGLGDEVAGLLLGEPVEPLIAVQVRHLGGALARPVEGGGAVERLTEPYLVHGLGAASEEVSQRLETFAKSLAPYGSGRRPYTMLHGGEHASAAFSPATLSRLRALKLSRDPGGVIRANFPVLA
ncbi:MAG: FAD-binding oxidoreductase [Nonomuraea sp.]|nr:FAD-binding oxidoreductase [Nonomuraea sp.]NUP65616.1 FAD-binding oxidoreductase [Nonomuraea sp.]NUS07669.1 FAD-binding oxidoreductase [Nonomuraea sp.]